MKITKRIALINRYFGKLPWYFDYFIHSCKYNPTIDFYIITDDITYGAVFPKNVRIINKELSDISIQATENWEFKLIKYGYKLCDFKPAYGLIFSDLLEGYDFWGHCDIDIIFGDISRSYNTVF